ncbi:MAG TPA: hypothetical protein VFD90_05260 [Gaiellales bacterium]|nr:hypothetical protein [Gaiellales bacterium]
MEAWVEAFDGEIVQCGDFAATVRTMSANGCFDVRAVVERWILANPTGNVAVPRPQLVLEEPVPVPVQPVLREAPALAAAPAPPPEPALQAEPTSQRPVVDPSPEIAHFHSLLQGGIDRAQIYEAFPAFRLVIDEAVVQYEAAAPILSEAPTGPTRQDLDDEIRRTRHELEESAKRGRRRWRSRG